MISRSQPRTLSVLVAGLVSVSLWPLAPARGQQLTEVAGSTLADYAEQIQSEDRVIRLRAARSLAPFGGAAGELLLESLDHEDAAVRFIAAEQLGRLGGDALEDAVGRLCELAENESSHAVRLAASFALCRHGLDAMHLPLLIETLDYPERGMACTAAYLIGEIGPYGKAAQPALEKALEANRPGARGGDYHLGGAAQNALRKIRSASPAN